MLQFQRRTSQIAKKNRWSYNLKLRAKSSAQVTAFLVRALTFSQCFCTTWLLPATTSSPTTNITGGPKYITNGTPGNLCVTYMASAQLLTIIRSGSTRSPCLGYSSQKRRRGSCGWKVPRPSNKCRRDPWTPSMLPCRVPHLRRNPELSGRRRRRFWCCLFCALWSRSTRQRLSMMVDPSVFSQILRRLVPVPPNRKRTSNHRGKRCKRRSGISKSRAPWLVMRDSILTFRAHCARNGWAACWWSGLW